VSDIAEEKPSERGREARRGGACGTRPTRGEDDDDGIPPPPIELIDEKRVIDREIFRRARL
jgi:hypothetical protein